MSSALREARQGGTVIEVVTADITGGVVLIPGRFVQVSPSPLALQSCRTMRGIWSGRALATAIESPKGRLAARLTDDVAVQCRPWQHLKELFWVGVFQGACSLECLHWNRFLQRFI